MRSMITSDSRRLLIFDNQFVESRSRVAKGSLCSPRVACPVVKGPAGSSSSSLKKSKTNVDHDTGLRSPSYIPSSSSSEVDSVVREDISGSGQATCFKSTL